MPVWRNRRGGAVSARLRWKVAGSDFGGGAAFGTGLRQLTDPELLDKFDELTSLLRQRVTGGRRLLHHCGVLLSDLVHLVDGRIDLA